MALAGFSVGEAEGLRRAMSRKRSLEAIEVFRERFVAGAAGNGVDTETANRVYDKLAAFSGFGFPKSHAAAFALLAYQSSWLRRYHPAEFLCALLNAQPMGFYPPASLVRDGQRRGVLVLAPDVNASEAACSIEDGCGTYRDRLRARRGGERGGGDRRCPALFRRPRSGPPCAGRSRGAPSARRVGRLRLPRRDAASAPVAARARQPSTFRGWRQQATCTSAGANG